MLALAGHRVMLVTPQGRAGHWSGYTAEQANVQKRLLSLGVNLRTNSVVAALGPDSAEIECVYTGRRDTVLCGVFVPVTSREPNDQLWRDLQDTGLTTLRRIGDCGAPGIIAQAVYDGHRNGEEFGSANRQGVMRERAFV